MCRLIVFNDVTLDGYFTDQHGDMSWAYPGADDAMNMSRSAFSVDNLGAPLDQETVSALLTSCLPGEHHHRLV
jgi:hypothetical protein